MKPRVSTSQPFCLWTITTVTLSYPRSAYPADRHDTRYISVDTSHFQHLVFFRNFYNQIANIPLLAFRSDQIQLGLLSMRLTAFIILGAVVTMAAALGCPNCVGECGCPATEYCLCQEYGPHAPCYPNCGCPTGTVGVCVVSNTFPPQ